MPRWSPAALKATATLRSTLNPSQSEDAATASAPQTRNWRTVAMALEPTSAQANLWARAQSLAQSSAQLPEAEKAQQSAPSRAQAREPARKSSHEAGKCTSPRNQSSASGWIVHCGCVSGREADFGNVRRVLQRGRTDTNITMTVSSGQKTAGRRTFGTLVTLLRFD